MYTASLDKLLEIHTEEMDEWSKRPYKNNFFEIAYIESGSGRQCINHQEYEYTAGNVFFLPPLDCHSFKIKTRTKFYFIRFTDHYFMSNNALPNYNEWFDKIAYIIANYNKIPGDIIQSDADREFIISNILSIHREYMDQDNYSDLIISGAIASILNILARSIEKKYMNGPGESDTKFGEILRYINKNILVPENLRLSSLSENFGISKSYFSEYFKKQAGVSLLDYILKSKLKIVETKVLHTDLSLKEIAWQMNFTDSSHLSRSFKKVYGMTVGEFKTTGKSLCSL